MSPPNLNETDETLRLVCMQMTGCHLYDHRIFCIPLNAQMTMNVLVATDVTLMPDAPTLSGATAVLATLDSQEMAAIAVVSEQSFNIHHARA